MVEINVGAIPVRKEGKLVSKTIIASPNLIPMNCGNCGAEHIAFEVHLEPDPKIPTMAYIKELVCCNCGKTYSVPQGVVGGKAKASYNHRLVRTEDNE